MLLNCHMKFLFLGLIFFTTVFIGTSHVYAVETETTYRDDGNATIWDGKWSFIQEWKRTSYTDAGGTALRIGHDYKYLYVFLDAIEQEKFTKNSDYGIVCITSNTSIENTPQNDDHCFLVALGTSNRITLQGGSDLSLTDHYTRVDNDPRFIAISNVSDNNDRYTNDPHPSYEFRIPIDLVGRSDKYHLFAATYDTTNNHMSSWPANIDTMKFPNIPSPSKWGDLISPDKSIPEFPWPMLALILSFMSILIIKQKMVA